MPALVVLLTLFACAALAPALARRLGRDAGYPLAFVFAAGTVTIGSMAPDVIGGNPVTLRAPWIPSLAVQAELRLDGLSLLFALLVLGVGVLVLSYCARYLSPEESHSRLYGLLTLFAASMLGLVLAGDVVLLFVFWELTSVCSFLLIGGEGQKGAAPATRALLVTGGGGLALLAGLVLAMVVTGTSDLPVMLDDPSALRDTAAGATASWLIMLAALTKSAQVPFHFWLPDVMVAITPVSAYLHAATMVKAGIYLLARFSPVWADEPQWTATLVSLGLASALFGALMALRQHDLKALLAYSTVSQLGWLVSLLGIGTAAAMAAALLHTFAHALFKASLFMLVGIVDREAGSRDVRELSGLWRMMPLTATATGLAGLSLAGAPPMLGFVSKEESFIAFLGSDEGWLGVAAGVVAALAAALTAAYGLRIFLGAFAGPPRQHLYEPALSFLMPAALAALAGLGFGLTISWLSPFLNRVVADARRTPGEVDLALWHGVTPALGLSALALTGGGLLFLVRGPVDRALQTPPARGSARAAFDTVQGAVLSLGHWVAGPSQRFAGPGQLGVVLVVGLLAAGVIASSAASTTSWPPPRPGLTQPGDWAVALLLGFAVASLVGARSRFAAVALLGVVGFVLVIWYLMLGAPDVALTQLLVETLTVVVVVIVLRRLPPAFPRATRRVRVISLAAACGVGAGAGTFWLTGRRDPAAVGSELYRIAEPETGGRNVVNTILVDFRGIDTLGEATVLAVVALGVGVALRLAPPATDPPSPPLGADRALMLRTVARPVTPILLLLAAYLLIRGHDEPGGGFIAGLLAGAAVVLRRLAASPAGPPAPSDRPVRSGGTWMLTGGLGLLLAAGAAALGAGLPFLEPIKIAVPLPWTEPVQVSSSLVFDTGVALVVVALVVLALRGLGGVR